MSGAAEVRRQTLVGLTLAAAVIGGWLALHLFGVFGWPLTPAGWLLAPLMIALQTWLAVGMFIVAHDAMHGSLAPGRGRLNEAVGQLALGLYAGFSFRRLREKHHGHHRAPGGADDPDFHAEGPRAFWAWYVRFFRTYFGWRELAAITAVFAIYLLLGAHPLRMALFWGLPALLSSLQLFTFGTWLPHRHTDAPFADHHNARTAPMNWWLSLLTCFHFGRHHEHHLKPGVPWWRLPAVRT